MSVFFEIFVFLESFLLPEIKIIIIIIKEKRKKCPTDWPYLAGPSTRKTGGGVVALWTYCLLGWGGSIDQGGKEKLTRTVNQVGRMIGELLQNFEAVKTDLLITMNLLDASWEENKIIKSLTD